MQKSHRFRTALVMGKFCPPHRGHKYLIEQALVEANQVSVIICVSTEHAHSGEQRAAWLREIHPAARILLLQQDSLGRTDEAAWTEATLGTLGHIPEAMFSSEEYGEHYASLMGSVHVMVDKERATVPCSASAIRSDPVAYLEFLEPCVREFYAPKTHESPDD